MNFELLDPIKIKLNEIDYKYLYEFYYYGKDKADKYYDSLIFFKKLLLKLCNYNRTVNINSRNIHYKKIINLVNKYVSNKIKIKFGFDRDLTCEFITINKNSNNIITLSKQSHQLVVFNSKVKVEVDILFTEESVVLDKDEYELNVGEAIFLKPHSLLRFLNMNESENLEVLIISIMKENLDEIYFMQE
jgi:hypothetical protein